MLSHLEAIFRLGAATTGYPLKVAKDLPIPGENSLPHRQFSSEVPPSAPIPQPADPGLA
jgi:hypothetical protein